jgi:ornithine cyclodeaminase
MKILFLSLENVIAAGGANVVLAAKDILQGFHLMADNKVLQPHKTTLKPLHKQSTKSEGLVNVLSAYLDSGENEVYGAKVLGAMPSNVALGLPRATGLITLFDGITKSPLCIMDAQAISATRTGAVTYLAVQKLAPQDIEEVGLVGAGVNMRTQLLGLRYALPKLKRVYVHSRGESKFLFAKEMGQRTELDIIPVDTALEAVKNKRLIVTCLPNVLSPIVKDEWLIRKGLTHINIGCYESETSILGWMDRVVADMWEQGKHRGVQTHAQAVKQGVISESKIEDLGPILTGKVKGRTFEDENIFFAPTGLGFEDIAVAFRVYQDALKQGKGQFLDLWQSSKWI